jgi:hypothetical protein
MAARKKATAADGYVGKAPLTIVKTTAGQSVYVYAGKKVPADVPEAELKRLHDDGFIAAIEAPATKTAARAPQSDQRTPAGQKTEGDQSGAAGTDD